MVTFLFDFHRLALYYHILQHIISLQHMHLSLGLSTSRLPTPFLPARSPQLLPQLHSCEHHRLITAGALHFFFPVSQGHADQMQIAEPNRPNGLHLKIIALTVIGLSCTASLDIACVSGRALVPASIGGTTKSRSI